MHDREILAELIEIRRLLASLVEQGKPREIPITVKAVQRLRDTVPPVRPCGCALCEDQRLRLRDACACPSCEEAQEHDPLAGG